MNPGCAAKALYPPTARSRRLLCHRAGGSALTRDLQASRTAAVQFSRRVRLSPLRTLPTRAQISQFPVPPPPIAARAAPPSLPRRAAEPATMGSGCGTAKVAPAEATTSPLVMIKPAQGEPISTVVTGTPPAEARGAAGDSQQAGGDAAQTALTPAAAEPGAKESPGPAAAVGGAQPVKPAALAAAEATATDPPAAGAPAAAAATGSTAAAAPSAEPAAAEKAAAAPEPTVAAADRGLGEERRSTEPARPWTALPPRRRPPQPRTPPQRRAWRRSRWLWPRLCRRAPPSRAWRPCCGRGAGGCRRGRCEGQPGRRLGARAGRRGLRPIHGPGAQQEPRPRPGHELGPAGARAGGGPSGLRGSEFGLGTLPRATAASAWDRTGFFLAGVGKCVHYVMSGRLSI
ncbi:unnamed protein product [Prorocentrum cordatum]|uniref:Skin secretory protein xP2-like n=1 Tax=Prorocentrum cordatum TaxID=2364126 RepID=A0ABN9PDQ3_9DINO|nr:unnamed protein product [Polarella glacialis]